MYWNYSPLFDIDFNINKRTVGYKYLLLHKQFIILKIMGYNNIESFRTSQKINIESNNSQNLELYLPEFFVNLFVCTSKK